MAFLGTKLRRLQLKKSWDLIRIETNTESGIIDDNSKEGCGNRPAFNNELKVLDLCFMLLWIVIIPLFKGYSDSIGIINII